MISRRSFNGMFAGSLLAVPLAAQAQQPVHFYRIGVLGIAGAGPGNDALRRRLRELGYTEGQDISLEVRSVPADGLDRLLPLAMELVRLKVDVIVAGPPEAARAAKRATDTIPIVGQVLGGDPVADGMVVSLARPGGNVTGMSERGWPGLDLHVHPTTRHRQIKRHPDYLVPYLAFAEGSPIRARRRRSPCL